ncbi:MAG: hypothetical protein ACRCZ2_04420 [Fusobacteriaceae bacterium]
MRAIDANEIRKAYLEKRYLEMLEERKDIFKAIEEAASSGRYSVEAGYTSYDEILTLQHVP